MTTTRRVYTRALTIAFAISCGASAPAHAQQYERFGQFDACLRHFHDADTHHWFAVENRCDEKVTVLVCGVTSGGCFELELRPGRTDWVGKNEREIAEMGGVRMAACRSGFVPVGTNDRLIERGGQEYRCKKV